MNYAIKDATNLTLLKRVTGGNNIPVLFTDYANECSVEFSSDRVFATAKGVNKVAFDTNKAGKFTLKCQVFDFKWLSILLGAVEENDATKDFSKREVLEVINNKVTLTKATPKEGTLAMFTVDVDNRSHLKTLVVDGVTDKVVDLTTEALAEGTKVVAYYLTEQANTKSFTITNDKYADAYAVIGETMLRSEMGNDDFVEINIPNCRPQGNFAITFSTSNIAELSATFDILADENGDMCEFKFLQ